MRTLSRREWVDLRCAHPDVDPADPTDDFAVELLTLAGLGPAVWDEGGEEEATRAYARALSSSTRDVEWARTLLLNDPEVSLVVRVATDMGRSVDEFLSWSDRSQDLAVAWWILSNHRCPEGHPREAMTDPDLVKITRTHCGVCAKKHAFEQQFEDLGPDHKIGWHTEVERVPQR